MHRAIHCNTCTGFVQAYKSLQLNNVHDFAAGLYLRRPTPSFLLNGLFVFLPYIRYKNPLIRYFVLRSQPIYGPIWMDDRVFKPDLAAGYRHVVASR